MKKRNYAINFEKDVLNALVLDEGSCVVLQNCSHHFALHPYHLNDVNESLKQILNKGIAKYDKALDGILLGYQNVKLHSTTGSINNDTCFIHVDISADFYLFKPEVGKTLSGTVNKKSEDHVGCLVHQAFNVSLPKPPDEDWLGSLVQIGQEILFRINHVDLDGRLPYIRATFISILSELDSGISTGEDTKPVKSKKKSKGKKAVFNGEVDTEEVTHSEKKKKKKRKSSEHTSITEIKEEVFDPQIQFEDGETYIKSHKKSKKRKRTDDYDNEASYENPGEDFITSNHNESMEGNELRTSKKKRRKLTDETLQETQCEQNNSYKHKKKHKREDY